MRWSEAEAYILKNVAPALVVESQRAVLPASIGPKLQDRKLLMAIRDAGQREVRMPRSLTSSLRAAFRNMKMYSFQAGDGREFVTGTKPTPLGAVNLVGSIREVLAVLRQKPACTRAELVAALRPGIAQDSPEALQVLSPLGWLLDKGHIIELTDGRLLEPASEQAPEAPASAGAEPTDEAAPQSPESAEGSEDQG